MDSVNLTVDLNNDASQDVIADCHVCHCEPTSLGTLIWTLQVGIASNVSPHMKCQRAIARAAEDLRDVHVQVRIAAVGQHVVGCVDDVRSILIGLEIVVIGDIRDTHNENPHSTARGMN